MGRHKLPDKIRSYRRRRGMPWFGRINISEARLDELPDTGSGSRFARILGISYSTLRNWIQLEGLPAHPDPQDCRVCYLMDKASLVEWLIQTKRHRPRSEY